MCGVMSVPLCSAVASLYLLAVPFLMQPRIQDLDTGAELQMSSPALRQAPQVGLWLGHLKISAGQGGLQPCVS